MTTEAQPRESGLDAAVGRIWALVRHGTGALSEGDLASLRRMDPAAPAAPFFKLAGLTLEADLPSGIEALEDRETRWAAVVVGLAHLGDLHDPGIRLGEALGEGDLSEMRFSRLLRADVDRLVDELPALARFLAAKGIRANWVDAARLIFSAGSSDEERQRRRLARDYYRAVSRKTAPQNRTA